MKRNKLTMLLGAVALSIGLAGPASAASQYEAMQPCSQWINATSNKYIAQRNEQGLIVEILEMINIADPGYSTHLIQMSESNPRYVYNALKSFVVSCVNSPEHVSVMAAIQIHGTQNPNYRR